LQPGKLSRIFIAVLDKGDGDAGVYQANGFFKKQEVVFIIVNEKDLVDGVFGRQHGISLVGWFPADGKVALSVE
jgi:hypothetical protein